MLPVDPKTPRPMRASCGPIASGGIHSSCSSACSFTSWLCESRARRTSCHRASRSISSWPYCSFPILLVKVLIARYYRHYSSALLFLGVIIFALSFALVAMNLVPYLLGRAASTGAPAPVSLGFFLTVCSGLGFLLLRRPRPPTPAGSRATPNDSTDGLTADASRPEIRRRRSSSLRLQLARIDVENHDTKTLRFVVAETNRV